MSDNTEISWTDATWNPVRGCTKVSEGCRNCYAMGVAARFSGPGLAYERLAMQAPTGPQWTNKVALVEDKLPEPIRMKRPRKIFVNSMSDLFHAQVPDEYIDKVFAVMALASWHTFQVLTKRPERMVEYLNHPDVRERISGAKLSLTAKAEIHKSLPKAFRGATDFRKQCVKIGHRTMLEGWPLPNVWIGTSVEDQKTAGERIVHLLKTPAAVRFLSCEPLLGPVDLSPFLSRSECHCGAVAMPLVDESPCRCGDVYEQEWTHRPGGIHWVIAGGESGPNARPAHPDWFRGLRDQCVAAGVAFHFKQWGEWVDCVNYSDDAAKQGSIGPERVRWLYPDGTVNLIGEGQKPSDLITLRVGKKAAGRLLDGVEHSQFPEVAR